jgi:hypothetical protein
MKRFGQQIKCWFLHRSYWFFVGTQAEAVCFRCGECW